MRQFLLGTAVYIMFKRTHQLPVSRSRSLRQRLVAPVVVLAVGVAAAGCASNPTAPASGAQATAGAGAAQFVRARTISVVVAPEARDRVKATPEFDQIRLLDALRGALDARKLMASGAPDGSTIEVRVRDVQLAAVVPSAPSRPDHVMGDVLLHSADGKLVRRFEVAARSDAGADTPAARKLTGLYSQFAELTVERLLNGR